MGLPVSEPFPRAERSEAAPNVVPISVICFADKGFDGLDIFVSGQSHPIPARGRMVVTPVRTSAPRGMVVCPTLTPATTVHRVAQSAGCQPLAPRSEKRDRALGSTALGARGDSQQEDHNSRENLLHPRGTNSGPASAGDLGSSNLSVRPLHSRPPATASPPCADLRRSADTRALLPFPWKFHCSENASGSESAISNWRESLALWFAR